MRRTFKETFEFTENLDAVGDDNLLRSIQDEILENPETGKTIAGTGGLRKMRSPDPSRGKGKRSGLRIIYLDLADREITYLIHMYGKDEAEDLTSAEKKELKALVSRIKGETDGKEKNG